MKPVWETGELEPSLLWVDDSDIFVGTRIHPRVARRFARHSFSLPAQHMTAWDVVLDPVTTMVFHEGTPLPWSCFFGPHDIRVPSDCAAARTRDRNGRQTLQGRRVYCGFNRHYQNYAHWITQCVPAIAGYATDPAFADGTLLLPPLPPGHERALELAGIRLPEIVRATMERCVAAEELVYSSLLGHHYAPSFLARHVFDRMVAACATAEPDATPLNERIYVSRADAGARPMSNEAELEARLADLGIATIVPGLLSVDEQIRRFHAARLVVGPHGAGLGNIVFCRPKSIMYELMPEHWSASFVGPSINLFAQTSGMHYWIDAHPVHGTWAEHGHKVPWTADVGLTIERVSRIGQVYQLQCVSALP